MPEEIEMTEKTFADPEVSESASETSSKIQELNTTMSASAADAGTQEYQQKIEGMKAEIVKGSTETIDKVAKATNTEIPEDKGELNELNDASAEVARANFSKPAIDAAKTAASKVPPETVKVIEKILATGGKAIDEALGKKVSPETEKVLKSEKTNMSKSIKTLADELNKDTPDQTVIDKCMKDIETSNKNFKDAMEKETKLKEDTIAKGGTTSWEMLTKVALVLANIGLLVGLSWGALALLSKILSGCYMFYNNKDGNYDKTKLQDCSDYYSIPTNNRLCSCGSYVPTGTVAITDNGCKAFTDVTEKTAPYCIGRGGDTTSIPCNGFSTGEPLQCQGSAGVKGHTYYAYQDYPPLGILSNLVNTVTNLPGDLDNDFSGLLSQILLYGGIIIGSLIVLGLLFKWLTSSPSVQIAAPPVQKN
jgi:hypothetical protein